VARLLRPGGRFGLVDNISPDASMMDGDAGTVAAADEEYNAMEKLRDPSHMRCLTLAEWRALVAQAGLAECYVEVLDKPMVFGPWADQQNVGEALKPRLKSALLEGSETFRAFIRPRENHGEVDFVLSEAVIVAAK
jgi:hypothetical protein